MRKLFYGIGALLVILVAAVLVGPSFIDWNSHKGQVERQVEELTGRKLTIAGDISISVLPAPALIAQDIAFANADGAEAENMVELGSIEVRVALAPLFSGEIQVSKVIIVEPVIELEKFADGGNNWTIAINDTGDEASTAGSDEAAAETGVSGGGALGDITLDHFAIEKGVVVYRDRASGATHIVDDINATLKAATLQGPFEATGRLRALDIPIGFEIGIDGVFQGRTVPVTAVVTAGVDAAKVSVSGNILNLLEEPIFHGRLAVSSPSVGRLASLVGAAGLPSVLNAPLALDTEISGSAEGATASELMLSLGETTANGNLDVALGDVPQIAVGLSIPHLDADAWLAGTNATSSSATEDSDQADGQTEVAETTGTGDAVDAGPLKIKIPDGIAANVDLVVESIAYRKEKAGPVRLSAGLAGGEVTVSQLSAQLPGAADIAMFGFLSAPAGEPSFNGEIDVNVGDSRGLSRWLGLDFDAVPSDRMRRLSLSAALVGNTENLQIKNLAASFDSTNVQGGITLALRNRLSFGAALNLDSIDLDPYIAGLSGGDGAENNETATSASASSSSGDAGEPATPENPFAGLSALTGFDANLRLNAGEVVYNGMPVRKIKVDTTVFNGDVTVREFSIGDAAGSRLAVDGKITGLGGVPTIDGLNVDFASSAPARLASLAGVDIPVSAKALGKVSLQTSMNGNVLKPALKGKVGAAGGTVWFDGQASVLPVAPIYDGDLRIAHTDTAALLRAFDVGYRPSGAVGGLDISTRAAVTASTVDLTELRGTVHKTSLNGGVSVKLDGVRPKIVSTLTLDAFRADPFLPAETASSDGVASGSGGTGSSGDAAGYAQGEAPWPKDPIDLSGLGAADATITLNAGTLSYQAIDFDNAVVKAVLADSLLTVEQLSGGVFGGNLAFNGAVDGRATPNVNGALSFKNASLSSLLTAVIGEPAALGALTVETDLAATGRSVADMVAALNGKGAFAMKGVDVQGATTGSAMSGFLGLIRGFGQIGAGLAGKKLDGLADVSAQYAIKNGVADVKPLNIDTALGTGQAGGTVDLAGWNIDLAGNLDVSGNLLTALLGQQLGGVTKLPFSVRGALDAPDVNVDTAALAGGGVSLPGLDKLEEKLPGVGSLLQGVLGGGGQQQPQQQQPSTQDGTATEPAPQQPSQQKQVNPENLLKDLLGF